MKLAIFGQLDLSPLPNTTANSSTISKTTTLVFTIVTSITLLVIVISGLRYVLARGDPGKTAQARESIIYATAGLVITLAAFGVVTFVLKGLG